MSFNADQFRELVIRPTLKYLEPEIMYSEEAEDLLFMTAAHESRLGTYLHQVKGPAVGVYQMEPDTSKDIVCNFLLYRDSLAKKVSNLCFSDVQVYTGINETAGNLFLATVMARVHYFRVKESLPKKGSPENYTKYLEGLARYAKKYYNTELGKATEQDYIKAFLDFNKG